MADVAGDGVSEDTVVDVSPGPDGTAAAGSARLPAGATLGLIAGNGRFPVLVARAAAKNGYRVAAVAMMGETHPDIEREVHSITWVRVGQLGRMIRAFRQAGVQRAAMAGGVRKARLFTRARPDLTGMRVLARTAIRRDDGLLRAVAAEFERSGIEIIDSTMVMPEVLAPTGVLTQRKPTPGQWRDLRYGLSLAKRIGMLDVGQTVVVKRGAAVALEAVEGTDACIMRAGALCGGGGVVVKAAKPHQDLRFDLPAVGPATIRTLRAARLEVLGLEAGRTLLLEAEATVREANRLGICVVGLGATSGHDMTAPGDSDPSRHNR